MNDKILTNTTKKILAQDIVYNEDLKGLLDDKAIDNISKENLSSLLKLVSMQVDEYNMRLSNMRKMCDSYQSALTEQNIYIGKMLSDLEEAYDIIDNLIAALEISQKISSISEVIPDMDEDIEHLKEMMSYYRINNLQNKNN